MCNHLKDSNLDCDICQAVKGEKRITIRVSKEELEILEKAAKKDDRPVSNFCRFHALSVAKDKYSDEQIRG